MSFNDVYEFIQGEYQQVTRIRQEPVSTADPTFFKDLNLVKWAGYSNEIWSAETGGTQLVQGLDYELQYLDVAASGPAGEPVYSGYSILTPLYYNIPLYQTANIVGAYTTRPYRPSYNVITADTTVTPASMDDSVIADATGGSFTVTIADGFHLNQRYSIICKGLGTVTVVGTGISAASFTGVGVSWLWDGGEWMPLAAPGAREGGIYYDWEWVFTREGAISATIPAFRATYGTGLYYLGGEFTYLGESDRTNGVMALGDDAIDRYIIMAVDVAGGNSTLSIKWDSATDDLTFIATGADFTDLNLWAVLKWTEYTYGGYGAWTNTAEAPPYGEAITSEQELYLDGTKEFVSSSGNAPVVDVVDYLPAVINVDGAETPEANSKWPGQRGTYGFFGEYTNSARDAMTTSDATISDEGTWKKITATGANAYGINAFAALSSNGILSALVRRGNTATTEVFGVSGAGGVVITWGSPTTFVYSGGAVSIGTELITDDIVFLKMKFGATGATSVRWYVSGGGGASGDYTYYQDQMVVDLLYQVPYTAGTHQPAKLQYNKDWSQSAEWTIDFWYGGPYTETAFNNYILDTIDSSELDGIRFYININGLPVFLVKSGGVADNVAGDFVPNDSKVHFKLVLVSATSIELFQDGVSKGIATTSIPTVANMPKFMVIGSTDDYLNPALGYIQDLTIQPGIDTSDAHYLAQLPYYSPSKTYGKNASWSIDARGNISGNNQVSGSIIQDEEINGQWVTRWDTGRMVITGTNSFTTNTQNGRGSVFGNASNDANTTFTYAVEFASPPNQSLDLVGGSANNISVRSWSITTTQFLVIVHSGAAASAVPFDVKFIATGRWK